MVLTDESGLGREKMVSAITDDDADTEDFDEALALIISALG